MSPKRKRSKPARRSRRARSARRNETPLMVSPAAPVEGKKANPAVQLLLYAIVVVLFAGGQYQMRHEAFIPGLALSGGGFLLLLALFMGWLDLTGIKLKAPKLFPPSTEPAALPPEPPAPRSAVRKEAAVRLARSRQAPVVLPPPVARMFPWGGVIRFLLIVGAFGMGVLGQTYMIRQSDGGSLAIAMRYYGIGILFFIAGLWGYTRENLKELPLNPKVEGVFFTLVMVLATVLRVVNLENLPSGMFIDQGFQGLSALRILHEGWRPFHVEETFHAPALMLYQHAIWFLFMPNTQWSTYLFFAAIALSAFPLIYWTFRQLAGPRVSLLTLYILAVMSWHINFSRNAFVTIQLPLYMFGTMAFLLHGLKTGKRRPFIIAALFFAGGLYTYQAYKIFPFLLILLGLYELFAGGRRLWENRGRILLFAVLSALLMAPILVVWKQMGTIGTREASLSIMAKCKQERSIKPFMENLGRTAVMWSRQGDPNPRHGIQDHRMLDDVTSVLFMLGLAYALTRFWRRKYFWGLSGFIVMSLPCVLSIDAAHANRMLATTPFAAFLAASAIAAVWGRAAALAGVFGEILLMVLLAMPLYQMAHQNITMYFVEQKANYGSYREYAIEETVIGKEVAKHKDRYESFVTPKFYGHFTVMYLTYFQRDHVKRFELPASVSPGTVPPGRGLFFAIEEGRTGVLDWVKTLYPKGTSETLKDPHGQALAHFYRVEPPDVDAVRGLTAVFSNKQGETTVPMFPQGLPPGPYHAEFKGTLFIDQTQDYRFKLGGPGDVLMRVDGRPTGAEWRRLTKGYHPVRISWDCPSKNMMFKIEMEAPGGRLMPLDASRLAAFTMDHGLKAVYFSRSDWSGQPVIEIIEPVLNFTNGNDFPAQPMPMAVHWKGTITAPQTGDYTFFCQTADQGRVKVDGMAVTPLSANSSGKVYLAAGEPHALDVLYLKTGGWYATFTLKWQRRGGVQEVVPYRAFGPAE